MNDPRKKRNIFGIELKCTCKCCSSACLCDSCTETVPKLNMELASAKTALLEKDALLGTSNKMLVDRFEEISALKAKIERLESALKFWRDSKR